MLYPRGIVSKSNKSTSCVYGATGGGSFGSWDFTAIHDVSALCNPLVAGAASLADGKLTTNDTAFWLESDMP